MTHASLFRKRTHINALERQKSGGILVDHIPGVNQPSAGQSSFVRPATLKIERDLDLFGR
jgi:hypothetical protein